MAAKLEVNFVRFASGRPRENEGCLFSITGHLIGVKNNVNFVGTLIFRG